MMKIYDNFDNLINIINRNFLLKHIFNAFI